MPVLSADKWVTTGQQFPTVTWSFATFNHPLAHQFSGYRDFEGVIEVEFRPLIRAAFDAWEAVSLIDFVELADSSTVNIRFGDILIDGKPSPGQQTTLGTAQYWSMNQTFVAAQVYFDIDAYDDKETFYQVALHEIGHAIGLGHSTNPADTMYFLNNPQNEAGKLSAGDIAVIKQLYGEQAVAPPSETDFAAAAASLFFLKALPTAEQLSFRGDFAEAQYNFYANTLQVANPGIGPYEALGAAFSSLDTFKASYGALPGTAAFVQQAYQDVFQRAPVAAQVNHFVNQVTYFHDLYVGAGMSNQAAELQARGAAAGQMLGFAMTSQEERARPAQTLDDSVTAYLAQPKVSLVGMIAETEAYYGIG